MRLIKRKNFYYLGHSFRKNGKPTYRERYIGKCVPENIEEIKEAFLRKTLQEDTFLKLSKIKKNFQAEWKKYPESVKKKFLIDLSVAFTYNTNAIEGSTITLFETAELIRRKMAPNRPLEDVLETISHARTFLQVLHEKKELSLSLLLRWHKNLFCETKDIAGKIRDYSVRVGEYRAPDWQDLPVLLRNFFIWYRKSKRIMHPVELAARAHYKFEKIHPFGDGNGRVGRLLITYILRRCTYPILNIEYKRRKQYYYALTKDETAFLQYFLRRYINYFGEYWKS